MPIRTPDPDRRCSNCGKAHPSLRYGKSWCPDCRREGNRRAARDRTPEQRRRINAKATNRYHQLAYSCRKRRVLFTLTREAYADLLAQPCHYCGFSLAKTGSGLDQIVPDKGYTPENVVPCCVECNTAKADLFSYTEALTLGQTIRAIKLARSDQSSAAPGRGSVRMGVRGAPRLYA